jgi:hypothetical protein
MLLYPAGESPQYTQNRGCVGPGACLDVLEKIKSLLALSGIEPQLIKHPQHSLVTMLTKLYWLYL